MLWQTEDELNLETFEPTVPCPARASWLQVWRESCSVWQNDCTYAESAPVREGNPL